MTDHDSKPAEPIDPRALGRAVADADRNVSLGAVNDHDIRMSVMTGQFAWHRHPGINLTRPGGDTRFRAWQGLQPY